VGRSEGVKAGGRKGVRMGINLKVRCSDLIDGYVIEIM